MKFKHHVWTSLLAGGTLWYLTGSEMSMAGALIGGVAIDADHLIDQLWSIKLGAGHMGTARDGGLPAADGGRPSTGSFFERYVRRRRLVRLPLIFHSYELMAVIGAAALVTRTPFLSGLATGYCLHILLDFVRHRHEFRSQLFYLISYRLTQRFRRDRLIKGRYL
jgi:hypothetical protein